MHALDQQLDLVKREFDRACAKEAQANRKETTRLLNQALRRIRQYESEAEWTSLLLEGASNFARQLAVFELRKQELHLREQRGLDLRSELILPLRSAPAIASATESKDPIVALRTSSEVGPDLSIGATNERVRIIPIANGDRIVAVLFAAESGDLDANGLELIAGMASVVLERKTNASFHTRIKSVELKLPDWGDLSESEQTLHLRAQRFSRVAVAEAQLSRPEACEAGRRSGDIYFHVKAEIDSARDTYRRQFMVIASMVDYLHLELVRVLAGGNEAAMGLEYPGAMVSTRE